MTTVIEDNIISVCTDHLNQTALFMILQKCDTPYKYTSFRQENANRIRV